MKRHRPLVEVVRAASSIGRIAVAYCAVRRKAVFINGPRFIDGIIAAAYQLFSPAAVNFMGREFRTRCTESGCPAPRAFTCREKHVQ